MSARFRGEKRQIAGGNKPISRGRASLNYGDTEAASSALNAHCGGGANVGAGKDFHSISGCTVAYFCNLAYFGNFRSYGDECFAS